MKGVGKNIMDIRQERNTKISKEDLMLHPVRMRIILAAASQQEITAQQLIDEMPDVSPATLYRNINLLAGAGILVVLKERRVRNTIEKTFALRSDKLIFSREDLSKTGSEDYMRFFTEYLGILLGYFGRYLARETQVDLVRDHVAFNLVPLSLSDDEAAELMKALQNVLAPFTKLEPSPDRQRRILGLVTIPDSHGHQSPPMTSNAATSEDNGDDLEKRIDMAVPFVNCLALNEFSEAAVYLNQAMRTANANGQLAQAWHKLINQAGTFRCQTGTYTGAGPDYQAVYVACQFENNNFDVQLFFNKQGYIAGMQFLPATLGSKLDG